MFYRRRWALRAFEFGSPQELSRAWLRINAAGTKVTFTKVRGRAATKPLNTYRLELKSGKRTR